MIVFFSVHNFLCLVAAQIAICKRTIPFFSVFKIVATFLHSYGNSPKKKTLTDCPSARSSVIIIIIIIIIINNRQHHNRHHHHRVSPITHMSIKNEPGSFTKRFTQIYFGSKRR